MKLGTRATIHQTQYEVVSILRNGGLRLRRVKGGKSSNGVGWDLGERVRIVGVDQDEVLEGVISLVGPIRATVTTLGVFCGCEVPVGKIRKAKERT